jgi:hypothetical protein
MGRIFKLALLASTVLALAFVVQRWRSLGGQEEASDGSGAVSGSFDTWPEVPQKLEGADVTG